MNSILEANLAPRWRILAPHWFVLAPSWSYLGSCWRYIGATLARLGSILGVSWLMLAVQWRFWAPHWLVLALSYGYLDHIGASGRHVGSSWLQLGAVLAHLGTTWPQRQTHDVSKTPPQCLQEASKIDQEIKNTIGFITFFSICSISWPSSCCDGSS